MKNTKFELIFVVLLSVIGLASLAQSALALTVSPVRMEVSGNPGQTLQGVLILTNEQNTAQKFYSSYANFEARGNSGTPYFVPATQGLGTWMTVPQEVDLQSGEQQNVPFSITIPGNATPGGYYAAIFWGQTPPNNGTDNQVSISGRLGILVLLTVNGDIKVNGALSGFKANGQFFQSVPVSFQYNFSNAGGDRIAPTGNIYVKNLFGFGWTTVTLNANALEGNVLPNSVRTYNIDWGNISDSNKGSAGFFDMVKKEWNDFNFGAYVAQLNLNYGQGKTATANYSFYIFPWQLLLVILIILIIIVLLVVLIIRKWDKWIVKKSIQAMQAAQATRPSQSMQPKDDNQGQGNINNEVSKSS